MPLLWVCGNCGLVRSPHSKLHEVNGGDEGGGIELSKPCPGCQENRVSRIEMRLTSELVREPRD